MKDRMEQGDFELPLRLREELGSAARFPGTIPADVDGAIVAAGRGHLRRWRVRRVLLRWGGGAAAAAALLLVAVRLALPPGDYAAPPEMVMHVKDINRDGTVDILDAFALAVRIERGEPLDPAWDFSGDGNIGTADVERVALAAVRLEGAMQ